MLWGITIDPCAPFKYTVLQDVFVSFAVLDCQEGGHSKQLVHLNVQQGSSKSAKRLLCSFIVGYLFQQNLNLKFSAGEEITFTIDGPNKVHLNGYTSQPVTDDNSSIKLPDDTTEKDAPQEKENDSEMDDGMGDEDQDTEDYTGKDTESEDPSGDSAKDTSTKGPEDMALDKEGGEDDDKRTIAQNQSTEEPEDSSKDRDKHESEEHSSGPENKSRDPSPEYPEYSNKDRNTDEHEDVSSGPENRSSDESMEEAEDPSKDKGTEGDEGVSSSKEHDATLLPKTEADKELLQATNCLEQHLTTSEQDATSGETQAEEDELLDYEEDIESQEASINEANTGNEGTAASGSSGEEMTTKDNETEEEQEETEHEEGSTLEAVIIPEIIILSSGDDTDALPSQETVKRESSKKRKARKRKSRGSKNGKHKKGKKRHHKARQPQSSDSESDVTILKTIMKPPSPSPTSEEEDDDESGEEMDDSLAASPSITHEDRPPIKLKIPFTTIATTKTTTTAVTQRSEEETSVLKISLPQLQNAMGAYFPDSTSQNPNTNVSPGPSDYNSSPSGAHRPRPRPLSSNTGILCLHHLTNDPSVSPKPEEAAVCILCKVVPENNDSRNISGRCPRHQLDPNAEVAKPEQSPKCVYCKIRNWNQGSQSSGGSKTGAPPGPAASRNPLTARPPNMRELHRKPHTRPPFPLRRRTEPSNTSGPSPQSSRGAGDSRPPFPRPPFPLRQRNEPSSASGPSPQSSKGDGEGHARATTTWHASRYPHSTRRPSDREDNQRKPHGTPAFPPRIHHTKCPKPNLSQRGNMARYVKSKYSSKVSKSRRKEVNETLTEKRSFFKCRYCRSTFYTRVSRRIHEEFHTREPQK